MTFACSQSNLGNSVESDSDKVGREGGTIVSACSCWGGGGVPFVCCIGIVPTENISHIKVKVIFTEESQLSQNCITQPDQS